MDWAQLAQNFGLPGLMLGTLLFIAKLWVQSNEKVQMERIRVEDKKADATVLALTSLSAKIDTHHTLDIKSHAELGEGIAEMHGKLDEVIASRERSTPIEGLPIQRSTPTSYGPMRPSTKPGDR